MRWTYHSLPPDQIAGYARAAGLGSVLAELLLRAGVDAPERAATFLKPPLAELADPFRLQNLDRAVDRLLRALAARESIVVLGDYDVDGVSSTALLVSILRRFGAAPRFVVPRRMEDGYGLSRSAIDRALEGGRPGLFVALDCGTNAHDEVAYLESLGVDVLVVDHHRSKEKALERGILINPHVYPTEDDAAWRHLCTVGLVFKLVHGLVKRLRERADPVAQQLRLRDHLDLVALGTIADLVPLQGENRLFARHGLAILESAERPGLRALMEVAGIKFGQPLHPVDVSFRLGPRINASGRLADAALSVELMLSADSAFCHETARQLDAFNRERQDIERKITEEAERLIETQHLADAGIVLYDDAWHPGVVGIVAGRVTRKYHRPCIVLGNESEGVAKGSGRSVDGLNLIDTLGACADVLQSWGGHPMAVGVSLGKEHLPAFRARFAEGIRRATGGAPLEPELAIAAWLTPEQANEKLLADLEWLHPFGQGNPEPVFGLARVVLRQRPEIFKAQHFRFHFDDSARRRLFGVAWKMADRVPAPGVPVDLAVQLHWNHFNDRKLLQLELVDWRPSVD
jgi:single-stranded-DNA-specific exonuclease